MKKKVFKIKERLVLDEERILKAIEESRKEKNYDHTEVWELLEIDKENELDEK